MISQALNELRERYQGVPNYEVPSIVWLDRDDSLANEKVLLERLATAVPATKRKAWISQFAKADDEQFVSVWFEMMLFDWLSNHFAVKVEPRIEGNDPDFSIDVGGTEIVVEAKAILKSSGQRAYERLQNKFLSCIATIPASFLVIVKELAMNDRLDFKDLMRQIETWLASSPQDFLEYKDNVGNQITLTAVSRPKVARITTIGPTTFLWGNPDLLKPGLNKKAQQHKALRDAGYPYIIAVFLEPS